MFSEAYVTHLSAQTKEVYSKFDERAFTNRILEQLSSLELNQRMRLISSELKRFLPESYPQCIRILREVAPKTRPGYTRLVFPDFVSLYGKEHFDDSLDALRFFTVLGSSEFAIREFLKLDFERTMKFMHSCSRDSNEHVRRLSSEGSRPRLPWSFKLEELIKHPEKTFPLLNRLKTDSSLYVRKSVANHLNDISKDHPDKLIAYVEDWDLSHPHTSWIVKRACRTLIKKGNRHSLQLFEFEKKPKLNLLNLKLTPKKIKIGEELIFSFDIISQKSTQQKLAIDYLIHYVKPSGNLSPKVFKLKELSIQPFQKLTLKKKHSFKHFSTRRQHSGKHLLEIQINGVILTSSSFELVD